MRPRLSMPETALLLAVVLTLLAVLLAPALPQPADQHAFADRRALWGIPHAMDVLSNLPFALAALAGGWLLWRLPRRAIGSMQRAMAELFFAGLLLVAIGSGWYHLQPDDAGLAVDRYAMAIAFAGLLGLAAAGRVSERAGTVLGLVLLVLAPLSVWVWSRTGNVLPWAAVQFGGLLLLVWFALLRPADRALAINWWWVLLAYGAAKLLELNDHAVFELTGGWVAGHTLKHVAASLAALPVLLAVGRAAESRQNALGIQFAKELGVRQTRRA
jgi:hypothetical protein